jgi:hypothetical protein
VERVVWRSVRDGRVSRETEQPCINAADDDREEHERMNVKRSRYKLTAYASSRARRRHSPRSSHRAWRRARALYPRRQC